MTDGHRLMHFFAMIRRGDIFHSSAWPHAFGLVGLVMFILSGLYADRVLREVVESTDARSSTRNAQISAVNVFSLLKDVETSQRGYLLSGEPDYLAPYDDALARLPDELNTMRSRFDGLVPEARQRELVGDIERRLALAGHMVDLRRSGNLNQVLGEQKLAEGKAAMDRLREEFAHLEADLNAQIEVHNVRVKALQRQARAAAIAITVLAVLLLALAYRLLLREQSRRLVAEQALAEAAENQARQRGAELASVFEALPDLFFRLGPDGVILDYRARRDDLYIPPERFVDRRMQDVLPPDSAGQFADSLAALRQRGGLRTFEYVLSMPNGERHYEARLNRLPDGEDVVAVVREITERVEAEHALRQARDDLRAFAVRLDRDIEQVRRRLAREVHDQIGQIFTALKLGLAGPGRTPIPDAARLAEFDALLDEGIRVSRRISADLRPALLDDLGLGPALVHQARMIGQQAGFGVESHVEADDRLSAEQTSQLFRIGMEALANVVRHAGAGRVRILGGAEDGHFQLAIEDDGRGGASDHGGGLGMVGMRERAALIGASLTVGASPSGGVRVAVRVPLGERMEDIDQEASDAAADRR